MGQVLHQRGVQRKVPHPRASQVSEAAITVPWLTAASALCWLGPFALQMPPGTTTPTLLHVALLAPAVAGCAGCLGVLSQRITAFTRVQLPVGQGLQILQHLCGYTGYIWQRGADRSMTSAELVSAVLAFMPQVCLLKVEPIINVNRITLWAAHRFNLKAPCLCTHPGCQCLPTLVRWKGR